eukprot:776007-Pleurochrysis_carterae.AAC.1
MSSLWGWRAEYALVEEDAADSRRSREARQVVVRRHVGRACSLLPSIAKRESVPRDTGDSKMKLLPRMCVASAILTQLETIALARSTVAGRPPSLCGTPIGYLRMRRTCGAPGSKRAADHVEHGGDATTAT